MNRFILYLFGFLLLAQVNALACNFKISNFGDPKKDYSKMKIPVEGGVLPMIPPIIMPDQFGGETVFIPTEDICVNEKSLYGTAIDYLYVDSKLVLITATRSLNDKNLLNYAMQKFGFFDLPKGIKKIDWQGNYTWESGNDIIQYIATSSNNSGKIEILQITSKLYDNLIQEYRERIIKWLEEKN